MTYAFCTYTSDLRSFVKVPQNSLYVWKCQTSGTDLKWNIKIIFSNFMVSKLRKKF